MAAGAGPGTKVGAKAASPAKAPSTDGKEQVRDSIVIFIPENVSLCTADIMHLLLWAWSEGEVSGDVQLLPIQLYGGWNEVLVRGTVHYV
jgi:hypothetical protein